MNLGQIVQSHALSFFHLSAPDLLLGWDTPPAKRNVFGLIAAERRPRPRRHPAAPVRPGDHRAARRQEDSSRLGRARRRAQPADRGRPRPDPRLAAGSVRHHADSRSTCSRRRWRRTSEEIADLRQLPVAVHGPGRRRTAPGNITAASSASSTAAAASSPTSSIPQKYDEFIGEAVQNVVLSQVAVLHAARVSRTASTASARWRGSTSANAWACRRRTRN